MKFSEQWLREWVDPPVSTEELAHQLTMAGLEVDAIEPVAGEFSKVVVAEVQSVEAHPDADRLRVCQVDAGQGEPLQIVCGAANVRAGLKVPCALVGATLPGDFRIKKSKLRGVASHGMLCSEQELGLAESAEGLMELPANAPVGEDIRVYLKLDDHTIELGLTPNRGDCLSIAGIARETAVLNRLTSQGPALAPVPPRHKDTLTVSLSAEAACPHYAGRIVRKVDVTAATPLWMVERLRRSGIRSLGPVVDVTNYVLLELGQPMHAFDLAKLDGNIDVRLATAGETLTLLDGQEVTLDADSLVIADDSHPVALAGIMGGADTAVSDATRDIFLESAFFDPEAMAGKARRYGLHTDSSHRFERGVSPDLQVLALERATALLVEIVGGEPGPVIEVGDAAALSQRAPVPLRLSRIPRILGHAVPEKDVEDILELLGMRLKATRDGWQVTPPAFRFDIALEQDLIEEVGRIWGYDRLTAGRPTGALMMTPRTETRVSRRSMAQALVGRGYQEAITYSFVDPELRQMLDPEANPVSLANPIASDMSVMRTSLWPGLVAAAQYNLHRQQERLKLFEYGLKFNLQDSDILQDYVISGVVTGRRLPEQWGAGREQADFYDLKGDVEALLALGRHEDVWFEAASHPALHPGQSARIRFGDHDGGWIGRLHPALEKKLDLPLKLYLFEISAEYLSRAQVPAFEPLSRYPAIRRDVALEMDETVSYGALARCIREAGPEWLRKVEIFDEYRGEGIDSGRKSVAIGLTLQDLSRTLTEDVVNQAMNDILAKVQKQFGATLRD
ncbi:MAG TPA: phenylalanine--tRNA ligase subunit beta [Gammaproteobacteria bacterium]|nr:phenylalanine--tRNA ligase subunit beta [Gammaproteobacteria bacterium]